MSAQKTKFPKNIVPARKMHGGTTIVGKNGLPIDALATIEPGTILIPGTANTLTYSAPTVTITNTLDISILKNFTPRHTGALLFTDVNGADYFIDPNSIDINAQTFDIYITEDFTSSPTSIATGVGWAASEAELVNRLQTTSQAVVDSIEFRDVDVNFSLDGSTDSVAIVDTDGNELDIQPDGSINVNTNSVTTPTISNIPIPTANVEQSFVIPDNTKRLRISARGNAKIQIAFLPGQTSSNYITIHPGNVYEESNILTTSKVLYFRSSKSNEVLEILNWT
jgi:hypothetical protein